MSGRQRFGLRNRENLQQHKHMEDRVNRRLHSSCNYQKPRSKFTREKNL